MSANEFDCLTNTILQAGIRNNLPVAFALPGRVREILATRKIDVRDVRSVTIHQCPKVQGLVDYRLEVFAGRGLVKLETFQGSGLGLDHDTYTLYDRLRDGPMKHLHLLH
jgi:hypothetical protein